MEAQQPRRAKPSTEQNYVKLGYRQPKWWMPRTKRSHLQSLQATNNRGLKTGMGRMGTEKMIRVSSISFCLPSVVSTLFTIQSSGCPIMLDIPKHQEIKLCSRFLELGLLIVSSHWLDSWPPLLLGINHPPLQPVNKTAPQKIGLAT